MKDIIDIQVLWGAYYSSKQEDGTYSAIRLLDFNKDTYHFSIFQESFSEPPSFEQVEKLRPFIQHVPQGLGAFFHKKEFQFLGGNPLTKEALNGYMVYCEAHGVTEEQQTELTVNLIRFSKEPPLGIRLELKDDEVLVRQID